MVLDPDGIAAFERQGYVTMPEMLAPAEVAVLEAAAQTVLGRTGPEVAREADGAPHVVYGMHLLDKRFEALARHPRLLGAAEQLLGAKIFIHQSRVNIKQTGGSIVEWHQDFGTYHRVDGLPEPRGLMIAIFVDEVTACNAPVMVIPSSHHHGLAPAAINPDVADHEGAARYRYDLTAADVAELAAANGIEAILGPAGTVLFMQLNLVHASSINIAPLRRIILYLNVSTVDNRGTSFARPDYYAARDFAALEPLAADCLLAAAR